MAKIMCMDNEYEIKKGMGIDILESFLSDKYYNCVDAGEKEICFEDLDAKNQIIFLEELKRQLFIAIKSEQIAIALIN